MPTVFKQAKKLGLINGAIIIISAIVIGVILIEETNQASGIWEGMALMAGVFVFGGGGTLIGVVSIIGAFCVRRWPKFGAILIFASASTCLWFIFVVVSYEIPLFSLLSLLLIPGLWGGIIAFVDSL